MDNNFILDLIASLQKSKSKKQIKTDVKSLGDIYVKLIGNLDLTKTRQNIKKQLKGLNLNGNSFTITPTINTKGVQNATKQAVDNAQKVANSNSVQLRFDTDKQKLLNQIKILGKSNSKLFNNSEMTAKYNQLLNSANIVKSKSELKALRGQLSAFRTELVATNNAGLTWGDKFKASISRYAQFFNGASFVYTMVNQLRNAATEAKTLDDRLVDLQKVTDEIASRDALYKYFDRAMSKAQDLNVKVDSLIYAITEFKKLGWSLSDAELGGEWATILENVGDVSIDTAIGSIKTAIASFDEIGGYTDMQMDKKLEAYTDLINNMSNKYSIDAEGLAEAIRLSAGTLTEAHTSIEQAATMFATANKYYNDPSYLGHTVKIGSLRMRASEGDSDAIEELKDMGEEIDNLVEATSSLREELLALTGVDIMVDEHTFKSYYDQLYEISQVIDDLNDTSRANVLETLFGKNRSAAGAALLSGMKESADAYKDAINSAGSATEEYNKWMQSADAASQRFANNLTKTYQSIISGNTVRDIANIGSAVLEFANNWGIVEGTLKGLLVLGVGKFLTTTTMAVISATKSVEQYGRALQLANNIPDGNLATRFTTLKSIAAMTDTLTNAQLKQVLSSQALTQQDRIRILQMSGMTKEMALQKLTEMGLTQATNAQTAANAASTASTFSLKAAMAGLGATMKSVFLSNPVGIALMAVSLGISAITSAISNHNQKMEEMRDKAKDAADKANTLGDEIADLANKYISLSEAVKTDASAKEDLMTTQTELLKKLGLEGESIDDLIAKYGSLSNAIRQASIDSLKNSQIDLIAGVNAAKDELLKAGADGFWGGNNIISAAGDDVVKAFQELEKAGIVNSSSYGTGGGTLVLIGDDKTTEGILENYKRLEDALNALRDSNAFTAEELSDNSLYQAIYGRYNEMKESVENYKSAITNLNENLSQQTMLTALQGQEIPKTEEAFNIFRQELIDTAVASKQFIGNEEEIANAVNNYLASVPEFEGYYSIPLENELDKVNALLDQEDFSIPLFNQLTTSEEALDQFQASVKSAKEAYSTLLSGDYSSTELLDSIQTINQAVSDMGGSLDWEFINQSEDSLKLLGDAIEHISEKYAESVLSGVGIDVNSEFGQMLANIIQEAYEAEAVFEGMNSQLDSLQSSYQTLTGILESYNETGYISLDNLQSLLTADENLIQMLEVENGQLVLNQAAYENLVAVQLLEFKAKLNDAAAAEIETLAKQKAEQATNQNADASQNAVGKLDAETAAFNRNTTAAIANAVAKAEESGVSEAEIQGIFDKYTEVWNSAMNNYSLDFDGFMSGGRSAASKAGGEHADAYIKAFEKEYSNLKDMLNRGEISEAQYLSRLRALYTKYFKDRKKYLDEYKKYESEYLSGMLDLHNKALSGISTLLNRKISAANDAKDASISALQEEKEKATEVYQSQIDNIEKEKDAIDDLIKEKNKKIDSINAEIDAIERAAESRKKNIQLEKDQFALEKMLNQRTSMVYKDGQFIWETDTTGIRDAREKVREDQEALQIDNLKNEISLIQKEIDLLEEKKDSLSEEQERIQKLMDESNKYYDNLIKQQEKYWDSIIKGMEQQKSRWEELAEVKEIAEAFSYIQQVFGDLGYTVEDVLNGSDAAFEDFKAQYISLISDVNNNSDFTEGLVYATGIAKENLGSFLDKTKETADGLDELGEKGSEMDSVAEGIDKISDSATDASTSTEGLSNNLDNINDALTSIPEADKFDNLTTSFTNLGDAIKGVADALCVGEEGTVGGLVSALQEISTLSIDGVDGSGGGIISQFQTLKSAVEDVANAISGGGSSGGDASGSSSASMSAGVGGKGASGLVGAIEEFKSATDEALGGGGEEGSDSEGGGTGAIPQFQELKTAVDDVTAAIGSGDSEGSESSGNGESDNLIGSITNLGETSEETLGEPDGDGVIAKFTEFKDVIEEAANQVKSISDGLDEIDGKEVECTITVNVKMNGSIPAFASGTVLGNMKIESATYNAQYGKAFASGTIGLPKAEKNALVSEYGQTEMTVLPDGNTIITDTPTLMDLPKDTVIYNEEETKKIMDNKVDVSGKAHAEGTDFKPISQMEYIQMLRERSVIQNNLISADEIPPEMPLWERMEKCAATLGRTMDEMMNPMHIIAHNMEEITGVGKYINNVSNVNNIANNNKPSVHIGDIHVTCPGVTEQQVAERLGGVIGKELDKQFSGFHNYTDQMSRMR